MSVANPFLSGLGAGRVLIGTWVMMLHDRQTLATVQRAGLDFVRLDMEHTPVPLRVVGDLARRASDIGLGLWLRPTGAQPRFIEAAIRAGINTLYLPQIEDAAAAERAVAAARSAADRAEDVHITAMLESRRAFANAAEIAAVPGVDCLAIGPADLAQDIGTYGTPGEAASVEPYKLLLRAAALQAGKQWEMGTWSLGDIASWVGRGCPILTHLTDTAVLRQGYREAQAVFEAVLARRAQLTEAGHA